MTDLLISLGNHLWQSTLFALCVAGLAVALRGIPARTRFWMWFAGLIKFLVPFSLLLSLGAGLAPKHTGGTQLQPAQFYSVDEVSQPFTYTPPSISIPAKTVLLTHWFPTGRVFMIVAVIWAAGFLSALCFWVLSWQRVKAVMRNASPEPDGMEAEILGRLRERMKVKSEVALLVSDAAMEPGIVGIWRSTLVWPRGISERLSEEQIEAVIAHELAHVSRRDNLTAALAMLGTAIFWFYPLVGWMKARMLDARERACDEAVLLVGHEPEVYASSILRACEFSIESPLACVSGITGSDLKERVRRIMGGNPVRRLSRATTIVLTALCATTIIAPIGFGFLDAPRASAALLDDQGTKPGLNFEVATVRQTKDAAQAQRFLRIMPGRFSVVNTPLRDIIMFAFDAKSVSQLSGYPDWVSSTHFDIEAKEDDATAAALEKLPTQERAGQLRMLVQALLVERFQLKVRREMKELPVYALVIAKGGPRLKATVAPPPPSGPPTAGVPRSGFRIGLAKPGELQGSNTNMDMFTGVLSRMPETEGRIVVNKTGLSGSYDITLKWTPQTSAPAGGGSESAAPAPNGEDSGPALFTALEEELGLKLESQKGSVEVLVVDHIEEPSPN
jgi:bla regulator protein blaR1